MNNLEKIISYAAKDNSQEFEKAMNRELSNRILTKLEQKKKDIANSIFENNDFSDGIREERVEVLGADSTQGIIGMNARMEDQIGEYIGVGKIIHANIENRKKIIGQNIKTIIVWLEGKERKGNSNSELDKAVVGSTYQGELELNNYGRPTISPDTYIPFNAINVIRLEKK